MRRRRITKRELTPDVKFNSELVARLINMLMRCGKKSVAQKIVYGAFDIVSSKKKDMEPLEVFIQAVENVKPKLEVKSRRVGGATYQVPLEVPADRQIALAIRWIVTYSQGKKDAAWSMLSPARSWMLSTTPVLPSRRKTIPTRWLRRIRRSLITDGNDLTSH